MEEEESVKYYKGKKHNKRYNNININNTSPRRQGRSFDIHLDKNTGNPNIKSYNISTKDYKSKFNLEKDDNRYRRMDQSFQGNCDNRCLLQCPSFFCPYLNHCNLHHIHYHHIHIPHSHFCPRLNYDLRYRKEEIKKSKENDDLLNEIAELRNECRMFKEELEKTKNDNQVENKYIKLLENKIISREKNNYNIIQNEERDDFGKDEDNLEDKYHNMLNKSFEVLNSVSNKCDDKKGKIQGDVNYYINKEIDYDELIEAQKNWLDNLPENYSAQKKFDSSGFNNISTFANTNGTNNNSKERFNDNNNNIEENFNNTDIFNNSDKYNERYYNNMSNFNKIGDNQKGINLNIDNFDKNKSYEYKYNLENQRIPQNQTNIKTYDKKIMNEGNNFNSNKFYDLNKNNENINSNLEEYNTNFNKNKIDYGNNNKIDDENKYSNDIIKKKYIEYNDNFNNIKKNNFSYNDYKNNIRPQNKNNINSNIKGIQPDINQNNKNIKENQLHNNLPNFSDFDSYKLNDNKNEIKKPSLNANDVNLSNNYQLSENSRNISINKNENPPNNNYNPNNNKNYINNDNNQNNNNSEGQEQYEQGEQEKEREPVMNQNNIQEMQLINNNPNNNQNNINNQNMIPNNNINENDENEEINPLNERYIIFDENGNPIMVGGQRLLGMELIPLIGEDGKEALDDNGNIILLGPDGQPKSQDELEPILLDNDIPLVNEENRPFLGFDGVPLINGYGNPVLGPGELYDNNNKVVKGVLGILPKDNMGNLVKVILNEKEEDRKEDLDENEGEEEEENNVINNDINIINNPIDNNNKINNDNDEDKNNNFNNYDNKNEIDYNNLRPLIGSNGKPVKDANNNYVILDQYNRPIKNSRITLLLDQSGKPILNSKSQPILIDPEGKPLNLEDNWNNGNIPNINSLINLDNLIPNQQEQIDNKNPKKKALPQNQKIQKQQIHPMYQKLNPLSGKGNNENQDNSGGAGFPKKNKKSKNYDENRKNPKMNNNNYYNVNSNDKNKKEIIGDKINIRDKRDKGRFNYSEVNSDSLQKINFMDHSEYKGGCFACDVGCSVSRSGYSPMNYCPYNNLIRRREVTPLKNRESKENIYY